jgi:hypothetical protein
MITNYLKKWKDLGYPKDFFNENKDQIKREVRELIQRRKIL